VTNDFIAMFKDSSIVSVITMVELTKVYGMLAMSTYDYIGLVVKRNRYRRLRPSPM